MPKARFLAAHTPSVRIFEERGLFLHTKSARFESMIPTGIHAAEDGTGKGRKPLPCSIAKQQRLFASVEEVGAVRAEGFAQEVRVQVARGDAGLGAQRRGEPARVADGADDGAVRNAPCAR